MKPPLRKVVSEPSLPCRLTRRSAWRRRRGRALCRSAAPLSARAGGGRPGPGLSARCPVEATESRPDPSAAGQAPGVRGSDLSPPDTAGAPAVTTRAQAGPGWRTDRPGSNRRTFRRRRRSRKWRRWRREKKM